MTVPPNPSTLVGIVESKATKDKAVSGCNSVMGWFVSNWKAVAAELLATCILILLGCMTTIPIDGMPFNQPMYAPIGFGFTVMFNIQIFGHISGAHMNPAVTFGAILWGTMSIPLGIAYVLAQCSGAILGYGILSTIAPIDLVPGAVCVTQVHPGLDVFQALGIEIALTAVLNFLNCAVWDPVNKDKPDSVPIKFGLAIAGLSLAGAPLTGASMNPARSLGPSLWTGTWNVHWVYWAGPFIGGSLSVLIYKFIWLKRVKTDQDMQ